MISQAVKYCFKASGALFVASAAMIPRPNDRTRTFLEESPSAHMARKLTALQQANLKSPPRRFNTKQELSKLRLHEKEMLLRWERDEDGWRELPARAWPAFQPNPEEVESITQDCVLRNCTQAGMSRGCDKLLFDLATGLVFYNLDPRGGLQWYKELAKSGNVDAMVACGIVLIEGMGVPADEKEGLKWLRKAVELGSVQGCYELGTVLYTGIHEVLDENAEEAFQMFERAAKEGHPGGMYMCGDCLVEGEGCKKDVARAVSLFYGAAEQGHRYARQRIRELLAMQEYKE